MSIEMSIPLFDAPLGIENVQAPCLPNELLSQSLTKIYAVLLLRFWDTHYACYEVGERSLKTRKRLHVTQV